MKTKDELPACPVATAVALVGGKWKLLIIRNLRVRPWRFNELQRDSVWAKFAYNADDGKNTMFRWAELTFTP